MWLCTGRNHGWQWRSWGYLATLIFSKLMGGTDDARILAARRDIATLMQALKI
jgi:hypothetical protein